MVDRVQFDFAYRPTILVVDDDLGNLELIATLLKQSYKIKVTTDGIKALQYLQGPTKPDLILLDIMMPGMTGYDVIRKLKADPETRRIPVIFLTSMGAGEDEAKGFELGAADYIAKPISLPIVMARVRTQLENKAAADFLRDQNVYLETEIERRTRELTAIQDVTIMVMASLAETRDMETGNHILRTKNYVRVLAERLMTHPRFAHLLTPRVIDIIFRSAPLHDIGKVGIPDRILLKPGRLTPEEFEIMKTHTTLGKKAIEHAEEQLGTQVGFLQTAKEIAYSHQEKWDGSGYPEGLAGDAIPVSARLMAVADVYDALISRRVYKDGMSHEEAVKIIVTGKGQHFDPDMVDAFMALQDEFRAISMRFADSDEDIAAKADIAQQLERLEGRPA